MKVELECDWPKGADTNDLDNDWHLKLGPKLGQLFNEVGLPTGAVSSLKLKTMKSLIPQITPQQTEIYLHFRQGH